MMDGTSGPPRLNLTIADPLVSFADEPLSEEETVPHLSELIRTYLSTMADLGAETWIMHGTLLAWWWNQKVVTQNHGCLRCAAR